MMELKSLRIVDSHGQTRILLETNDTTGSPMFSMCDSTGIPRISIGLDKGQDGQIAIFHSNGQVLVGLGSNVIGAGLMVCSESGLPLVINVAQVRSKGDKGGEESGNEQRCPNE